MGIENLSGRYYKNPGNEGKTFEISGKILKAPGDEGRIYRDNIQNFGPAIIKEVNPKILQKHPEASWEAVYNKYELLKKLGLPVVDTLMFDPNNNRYLMTDVTQGGRYGFIDRHHKNTITFVNNPREVMDKAYKIAEISFHNGNGVFLGWDAYGLKTEGGHGEVVITDMIVGSYPLIDGVSPINPSVSFTREKARIQAQYFLSSIEDSLSG